MRHDSHACQIDQLESYLQDALDRDEEAALVLHLDWCASCRNSLDAQSAEPATWSDASAFLRDQPFDEFSLSRVNRLDGPPPDSESAQLRSVLETLGPTDDPNSLGRLGSYEVTGVIGSGGMGVVMKGLDTSLDRIVAIKALAPHLASSGAARRRFAREAKAAAAVLHPNVIAIHGVSNNASLPYLVMPCVRGQSLQRRLDKDGPLELLDVLRIGVQVAAGLAAAHAQGLVHRDIKPANILLEDGLERVTITDFGLARAVDDASMTRSGVIAGTPQYMSPEQARGELIDARSDLFSLGSVLYAMCVGHSPFRAETSYGVLRRITDQEPRPIRELNAEITPWMCRLIAKLHAKNRDQRFRSAEEVEATLRQCIAHLEQPDGTPLPQALRAPSVKRVRFARPAAAFTLMLLVVVLVTVVATSWPDLPQGNPQPVTVPDSQAESTVLTGGQSEHQTALSAASSNDVQWDDDLESAVREVGDALEAMRKSSNRFFDLGPHGHSTRPLSEDKLP